MNNQVLSIEQMQELIDMGIDVSNASMYISEYGEIISSVKICELDTNWTPTFTLQDILDMLPKYIDYRIFEVTVYAGKFNVLNFGYHNLKFCQDMNSTLNSAFKLLKWCKENKYI